MISFFGKTDSLTTDENLLLKRSIDESANSATDLILKTIGKGDGFAGTKQVTADMQRLGLPDMGGMVSVGADLKHPWTGQP